MARWDAAVQGHGDVRPMGTACDLDDGWRRRVGDAAMATRWGFDGATGVRHDGIVDHPGAVE